MNKLGDMERLHGDIRDFKNYDFELNEKDTKGLYDNDCYFLSIDEDDKEWVSFTEYGFNIYLKNKTEVTYEEFKTLINEYKI